MMQNRAVAGVLIAGVLAGCAAWFVPDYGEAPSKCRMFTSDTTLVWAGRDRVRDVLGEGSSDIADFLPARAVSEDVVGEIYVARWPAVAGGEPAWQFCVISDDGLVYGFRLRGEWQPPSQ